MQAYETKSHYIISRYSPFYRSTLRMVPPLPSVVLSINVGGAVTYDEGASLMSARATPCETVCSDSVVVREGEGRKERPMGPAPGI